MAICISALTVSEAWLDALAALLDAGGEAVNLVVTIAHPIEELDDVRNSLDEFLAERRAQGVEGVAKVETVANTIFPKAWYRPHLGQDAEQHLYHLESTTRELNRRRNRRGTYFERFVSWPGPNGQAFNQLDQVITRLRSARQQGHRRGNAYEVGLTTPTDEQIAAPVFCAGRDRSTRGFPCLSHLSFSLQAGAIHLTAVYRSHAFIRRAYGNYLGIGRLLNFVAMQTGFGMGELTCVSAAATAELGQGLGFGRGALEGLVASCRLARDQSWESTR
jgi:hypothetical protein